ncbi:transposase [Acidithiobacillus ferrivorans]|uniref:transposase n=1 Tax=Acidithiobacillus ferrivorans TaxID=160808 RepID=UPI001C076BAB|nr:IS110 family transposase [Acidithiobacillus ferrivorans]
MERFHSAEQLAAYAGLNPRIRQPGQWAGKTPLRRPSMFSCVRPFTCLLSPLNATTL